MLFNIAMVHPLFFPFAIKSSINTVKKYRKKIKQDPFAKDLENLESEKNKWTIALNLIGTEYYPPGNSFSEFSDNAINALSVIEAVSIPYARYSLQPGKIYFCRDPKSVEKIVEEESPLAEMIYPKPKRTIAKIESALEDSIAETVDLGYIEDFENRKQKIIEELVSVRKKIKQPYKPRTDYSSVQQVILTTSKKIKGIEYDYAQSIQGLEYKRNIRRAKIGAAAVVTFATGAIIGAKLKKAQAIKKLI